MSTPDSVTVAIRERVARVRINKPESLNALDREVLMGLKQAFLDLQQLCEGAEAYEQCRAVIISSEGDKAFVAGADIKMLRQASKSECQSIIALGQSVMREIEQTPLPVVAMLQGFAIGGGLELALACDLIVASDKAKIGLAEINLGLIPGFGGTQRLAARCGRGAAKRLILTGDAIGAEEAHALGILDWVVPIEELESRTSAIAAELAEKGPIAVAAAKRAVDAFYAAGLDAGLALEIEQFQRVFDTEDAAEGLSAFVEKRTAEFKGR